jgi:hypothetical protein
LNAAGQTIAMCIIIIIIVYFGQNNSIDNVALAILERLFCVYLNIHNTIIKFCGQYWPYGKCCKISSDDGGEGKYVAEEVGTWLIIITFWIALFIFLPWSVDWYASTYYSSKVGSLEYNRGVRIAL